MSYVTTCTERFHWFLVMVLQEAMQPTPRVGDWRHHPKILTSVHFGREKTAFFVGVISQRYHTSAVT